MKLLRLSRRSIFLILPAILVVPGTLWAIVICLAPTDWAREKLVRELEGATGRKVAIGSVRLGPLGNVRIRDVEIAEHATADDPWLKVAEGRLDLHLIQMLVGHFKPTEIALDGLDLRVHRRADGTLEFADMVAADPNAKPSEAAKAPSPAKSSEAAEARAPASPSEVAAPSAPSRRKISVSLTGSRVLVLDDPSESRIELTEADGTATLVGTLATIASLKGRLNGGTLEFAAKYDRISPSPVYQAEMRARGVALSMGLKAIGLLVPVISDSVGSLDGRVDLELAIQGRGVALAELKSVLKGHGAIRLNPIDLSRSKLLDSLEALRQVPSASRVGSVESDFALEGGRVTTDDLTLSVASLPIILAGWTDFDGRLDYRVKSEALQERVVGKLPAEARAILGDVKQELGDLTDVRITGTVSQPKVTVGNRPLDGHQPDRDETKARLREAAKKLSGKYLR